MLNVVARTGARYSAVYVKAHAYKRPQPTTGAPLKFDRSKLLAVEAGGKAVHIKAHA